MNWTKIILIVVISGAFLLLFGGIIADTLNEIDWTLLDNPIEIMAEIIGAFIVAFDTAGATFPLTIQTILIVAGLGLASYTIRRVIKSE
jgi:uncharacterized membrane protein YeiH